MKQSMVVCGVRGRGGSSEGGVEEGEDAASSFLPHPLDAALNSSLPSKL